MFNHLYTYGIVRLELIAKLIPKLIKCHSTIRMNSQKLFTTIKFFQNTSINIMGKDLLEGATSTPSKSSTSSYTLKYSPIDTTNTTSLFPKEISLR